MSTKRGVALLAVLFGFSIPVTPVAQAAQVGRVIVDQAALHEFPQEGSAILARIPKDTQVTVSNVPTSGFYKARIQSGQVGWISGNDLFVKGGGKGQAPAARKGRRSYAPEDTRLQLLAGLDFLGYSGLTPTFTTTGLSAKSVALAAQFRLSPKLFWGIRGEYHMGSQAATALTNNAAVAVSQTIEQTLLPVMIGVDYNLMQTEKLRVGAGVYLGMAVISSTTISQTSATQVEEVKYSSLDPCGTLVLNGVYALSDALGAVLELGYRYHKTGDFPSTTRFGNVSGFSINYSGVTARLGVELKL